MTPSRNFVGSIAHVHAHSHAHTYVVAWWQAGERTQVAAILIYTYIYICVYVYIYEKPSHTHVDHTHFSFLSILAKFHRRGFSLSLSLSLSTSATEGAVLFPYLELLRLILGREQCAGRHVHIYMICKRWLPPFFHFSPPAAVEAELCIILSFSPRTTHFALLLVEKARLRLVLGLLLYSTGCGY